MTKSLWLKTQKIAHCGVHNKTDAPENSLLAFERAAMAGYAIELDIHVTCDNTVVVFHDETLIRMTGKAGHVKDLTANKLKEYKLKDSSQYIPTLKQVFDLINGKVPILVDIKSQSMKIGADEKVLLEVLKTYDGDFAIQTFNPLVLNWFAKNAPEILRGRISTVFPKQDPDRPKNILKRLAVERMWFNKKAAPNFIVYDLRALPSAILNKFKHLPQIAWTIYNNEQGQTALQYVDNIIFEGYSPNPKN